MESEMEPESALEFAQRFIDAPAANDAARWADLLAEDATLRVYNPEGFAAWRGRQLVATALAEEWAAWPDATAKLVTVTADQSRAAVEYRIKATEDGQYVEHNRAAILTFKDGRLQMADVYHPGPIRASQGKEYIAPASLSDEQFGQFLAANRFRFDARDPIPPNAQGVMTPQGFVFRSGHTHPGSNFVGGTDWTADEADGRIEEIIDLFRAIDTGFAFHVGPFDRPADLAQRLEAHGMVLAGEHGVMARRGLADLSDIPRNDDIEIVLLDGSDAALTEEALRIFAVAFHISDERYEQEKDFYMERIGDEKRRADHPTYAAVLNGRPVAAGSIDLSGSVAHLSGAGTLPDYRGNRVYATLLRQRLEDAAVRGYEIATIDAAPMSRGIVGRYGFDEFDSAKIYAWMPVIDMDVINTIVPTE